MLGPLVLALSLCGTAPSDAPPAGAVAAAAGHPARTHLRATLTMIREGRTTLDLLDVEGSRRLTRRCTDGLCAGEWFDGTHAYAFGVNGAALPDGRADEALLRTYAAVASTAFAEADFTRAGGSVERIGSADRHHERYAVRAAGGTPLIAIADARSHLLVGVERPDGGTLETFSRTRAAGFVLHAGRRYDTLERIAAALAEPAGAKTVLAAPSEIPLVSAILPIVPCALGGQRARCLIDTGTTPSGISLAFAERLKKEPHGEIVISAMGRYLTGVVEAGTLAIGSATIDDLHLAVIPNARDFGFDVILGSDALAALRLDIDASRRVVRLAASEGGPAPGAIPLTFVDGVPFVDTRLGDVPQRMLFDTGDSSVLAIGYDQYRRNVELFPATGRVTARGLGGSSDALIGRIEHATVGGLDLGGSEVRVVRTLHEGHVGFGVTARCAVLVLDYPQRRIDCRGR